MPSSDLRYYGTYIMAMAVATSCHLSGSCSAPPLPLGVYFCLLVTLVASPASSTNTPRDVIQHQRTPHNIFIVSHTASCCRNGGKCRLARTSDSRVLGERAARAAEVLRCALLLMGSRGSAA